MNAAGFVVLMAMLLGYSAFAADEVDQAEQQYQAAVEKAKAALAEKLTRLANGHGAFGPAAPAVAEKAKVHLAGAGIQPKTQMPTVATLINPEKLSEQEWDALPGLTFTVDATGALDTGLDMVADQTLLVIPNPVDKWFNNPAEDPVNFQGAKNYAGKTRHMAMCWRIGNDGALKYVGNPAKGVGRLFVQVNDSFLSDNKGSIRIKIAQLK